MPEGNKEVVHATLQASNGRLFNSELGGGMCVHVCVSDTVKCKGVLPASKAGGENAAGMVFDLAKAVALVERCACNDFVMEKG